MRLKLGPKSIFISKRVGDVGDNPALTAVGNKAWKGSGQGDAKRKCWLRRIHEMDPAVDAGNGVWEYLSGIGLRRTWNLVFASGNGRLTTPGWNRGTT